MTTTLEQNNKMGYLIDFEKAIDNHDSPSILRLWEEYTSTDEVEEEDFRDILEAVKKSELRDYIGRHIERGIHLWEKMEKGPLADDVLRLIVDLEMTNHNTLRQLTVDHLAEKFGTDPQFSEKMRLIGLRSANESFKGAISHFLLLNHMKKGNFVFHTAGWGVGEIMEVSLLREQLSLEFDYAPGQKEMSFKVAFATLIPLPKDHFLAQRFGNPDALEAKAKEDPLAVIHLLLKDVGPLTAAEIKDELCDLVIPEEEWNRWWQTARSKIKKDTQIESPSTLKKPFKLLKKEVAHEERLQKALESKPEPDELIQLVYNHLKDFSDTLKNETFKESLTEKLRELLTFSDITEAQKTQVHLFLQELSGEKNYPPIIEILQNCDSIQELIRSIPIQSFKKRILMAIRKHRTDWQELFLKLLFIVEYNSLRDFITGELKKSDAKDQLIKRLEELCQYPSQYPDVVIWYFQKVLGDPKLPLGDDEGKAKLFEAFLVVLSSLEQKGERRDLIKKMHGILSAGRYAIVRKVMKTSSLAAVKEFLLLISKCHSLTEHDIKIYHSLAEVAHPSLKTKDEAPVEEDVIWTTQEGYNKLHERIKHIGTIETVENAKEIEVARAHGDLRENAEFKAALERKDRLQSELKTLSDQLNKARVLTKEEIDTSAVHVGTTVDCEDEEGNIISYTLLGPWDADPDKNILSFQSKLAKSLLGSSVGDTIELHGKTNTIAAIRSAL